MKVYLAAPWFHGDEPNRLDRVEAALDSFTEDFGLEVFSPRRETLVDNNSSEDKLEQSFKGNVHHVKNSDFIVAIVDTPDKGTLFECGLAYAFNTPILYYTETLGEKPFNLMLAKSCKELGYVTSEDELRARIKEILEVGLENMNVDNYKGEIE